jgi:hypothetical protein
MGPVEPCGSENLKEKFNVKTKYTFIVDCLPCVVASQGDPAVSHRRDHTVSPENPRYEGALLKRSVMTKRRVRWVWLLNRKRETDDQQR